MWDRAVQRGGEHERDGRRENPPGREDRGHAERDRDARCGQPVVADDEVPPEAAERGKPTAHAIATRACRARSTPTSVADQRITNARTPRIAASPPGQSAPAPSADQKIPQVVSMIPTANFIVFTGTRASGARASTPTSATSNTAATAPAAASGIDPCVLPKVRTMNA